MSFETRFGKRFAAFLLSGMTFNPAAAYAQGSLADPAGSGVLVSAVGWLQGTLLGTSQRLIPKYPQFIVSDQPGGIGGGILKMPLQKNTYL